MDAAALDMENEGGAVYEKSHPYKESTNPDKDWCVCGNYRDNPIHKAPKPPKDGVWK